jgi:hypothetical protein
MPMFDNPRPLIDMYVRGSAMVDVYKHARQVHERYPNLPLEKLVEEVSASVAWYKVSAIWNKAPEH